MSEKNNENLVETIDEQGNKVTFELIDIVTVDDVEYALLIPPENKDDEDAEILVMRFKKDGDDYSFEMIENDEELEKVAQYIEEIENEIED